MVATNWDGKAAVIVEEQRQRKAGCIKIKPALREAPWSLVHSAFPIVTVTRVNNGSWVNGSRVSFLYASVGHRYSDLPNTTNAI